MFVSNSNNLWLSADEIGGHIPGSKNIPYSLLFEEDGTFKPVDELRKGIMTFMVHTFVSLFLPLSVSLWH